MSGPGGYPKLKAKAAEVKGLNAALLHVWKDGMQHDDPMQVTVRTLLEASVWMDTTISEYRHDYCFPTPIGDMFFGKAAVYSQACSALANWGELRVFNVTLKHHHLLHIACLAKWLNPRATWCFMGEDYMQRARKLMASCVKANDAAHVPAKALPKILMALHLTLVECTGE